MIEFKHFKDAKRHIVTMSYDDAPPQDYKLVEIFNKYGIKGTFHLTSKNLYNGYGVKSEDIKTVYKGHEVSVHTDDHPWLEKCSQITVINQVLGNRKAMEKECGYVVRGMSYPYGTYNDSVIDALKSCGIVYSRTVKSTNGFGFPNDFMRWNPTCHHRDAMPMCDKFINSMESSWSSMLFYIWGHSFEFENSPDKGFDYMEKLCAKLAEYKNQIWFATNIEIYDYMQAQRALHIAADESFVYNPTQIDVWISKDDTVYKVGAGETIRF